MRVKSNRFCVGAKVEARAPGIWLQKELRAGNGSGCDAPEVYFNLGNAAELDFVRVLYPSGARASVKGVKANGALTIEEPDIESTSCPWVFTWDGERFDFVADTLSAGVLGELIAPGRCSTPDPDEWLRIEGERLKPRGSSLEIRFVNALEEVTYLDQVRLLAADHPPGTEVHPNEWMASDPTHRPPTKLHVLKDLRPVDRATDPRGRDATAALARIDRKYFDGFSNLPFKGFAEDWSLTLDLGSRPGKVLLLHGYSSWNSSASAIAASQAGRTLHGPALDVQASGGAWREATSDMGVPAGLPRMILIDLKDLLMDGEHVLRIRTNRTIYFDQALQADVVETLDHSSPGHAALARATAAPLDRADLRWLGYPARTLEGGKPDYEKIEQESDWITPVGFLTRYGDVAPLLAKVDDRFVVMGHGDEVALSFDASRLPSLPPGWKRTFLFYSNGYEKGFELPSPHLDTVEPLPFRPLDDALGHTGAGLLDASRLEYLIEWNTR